MILWIIQKLNVHGKNKFNPSKALTLVGLSFTMGRKSSGAKILTSFTVTISNNSIHIPLDRYEAIEEKKIIKEKIRKYLKEFKPNPPESEETVAAIPPFELIPETPIQEAIDSLILFNESESEEERTTSSPSSEITDSNEPPIASPVQQKFISLTGLYKIENLALARLGLPSFIC